MTLATSVECCDFFDDGDPSPPPGPGGSRIPAGSTAVDRVAPATATVAWEMRPRHVQPGGTATDQWPPNTPPLRFIRLRRTCLGGPQGSHQGAAGKSCGSKSQSAVVCSGWFTDDDAPALAKRSDGLAGARRLGAAASTLGANEALFFGMCSGA